MKKTTDIKDYQALIATAQTNRPTDVPANFVRVDLWGLEFGEDWRFSRYREQADTKKYWKQLRERESAKMGQLVFTPGRGGKSGTWVHPLIASHYASWLSADFAILVNETFLRVLEGDSDLAVSIMLRDHNKERQAKAMKRVKVTLSNKEINELSHRHNRPYHRLHDDRNTGLYGMNTKQLRTDGNVSDSETPLNYLSDRDISYADAANAMVLDADDPDLMLMVASGIADLHRKAKQEALKPKWDAERLTPAKARKIAQSPNYQIEIPL